MGLGDTDDRIYPLHVKSLSTLKACYAACGENFSAILTKDGGVFTFGTGSYGQLGHNGTNHEYLPRKVADLMGSEVSQLACGRCHVLVYLSSSNRLYTFGLGSSGQLGIGLVNLNKTGSTLIKTDLVLSKTAKNDSDTALYLISSGGDQSFVITRPAKENIPPVDHRLIFQQNHILKADIIQNFDQPIVKENPPEKLVKTVAILNPSQLQNVETIFGSASCLNASFLDTKSHYSTSNRYPGVDISKVKEIHNTLGQMNDSYLNELIIKRLTKLYDNLPESPPSIEALRLYVTTPFLAEFEKYDINEHLVHSLMHAYAQSINRLKKESAGRVLDYWFAWSGVDFFFKLVNVRINFNKK